MAFYKPVYKKISGKYYPQAVVRGKPIYDHSQASRGAKSIC